MASPKNIEEAGSIGERIRIARKDAGLSQADLARRIGVSQPAIATWESGVHDPRRLALARLADALATPVEWLAAGARSPVESDRQAAAPYLRRPIRHVPVISFASAVQFAGVGAGDPHEMAEDYITVPASASHLFAVFVDDPLVERAFLRGSLVVIDYADKEPADGNFCLAVIRGEPLVRRFRQFPGGLETAQVNGADTMESISESTRLIGCARLSIRFH